MTDTYLDVTRAFNAPRDLVWRFWTEPELISKWFGPRQVHAPVDKIEIDMRVGGVWNIVMVDNASGDFYPIISELTEVVKPELFAGFATGEPQSGGTLNLTLRVEFHDHGEKTRVSIHQGPFTPEFRDMTAAGWEESFVKMDALFEAGVA